ncbi:MAG: ABC transporter permease [Planctomycetes bacterium]|nr:ABC transporter permease [Planctomycetota bacterium]
MFSNILRRLLAAIPMLLAISVASFLLLHALPGDPTAVLLGQEATPEQMAQVRQELGLNRPLHVQYFDFLGNVLRGDFGRSFFSGRPVADELALKVPATIELALAAMLLASIVGISLGVLAAVRPRGVMDFLCLGFALVGVSMPIFWLGFLAQQALAGGAGILPFGGRYDTATWEGFVPATGFFILEAMFRYNSVELTLELLHHLALPAMVLATVPTALIARMTRANMLEVLGQDYIRTARAKGLSTTPIVMRHALRNALIPVITSIGTQFGYLLGGAVLTETIFSWPGLGTYVVHAVIILDGKPLQASVLVVATFFVAVNLLTDISYTLIDPRLRHGGAA